MKARKLKRPYSKDYYFEYCNYRECYSFVCRKTFGFLPSTTLNNSVEFRKNSQPVMDEFKWMNVFHTRIPI